MLGELSDQIINNLTEIGSNEITQEVAPELKEIYDTMKVFQEKFNKLKDERVKRSSSVIAATAVDVDTIKKIEDDAYISFFNFQNAVNSFLGQRIIMVYVYTGTDGQVHLGQMENNAEHLDRDNKWKRLSYNIKNTQELLELELKDYDSAPLQETYFSVLNRYSIGQARRRNSRGYTPVLWYINKWEGVLVNNKGTIAEAYANFYINKVNFAKIHGLEYRVRRFMCDSSYGAASIDNTSGFIIGDVSQGRNQYAIKGDAASPMGMIQVAKWVNQLSHETFLTAENFKKSLMESSMAKQGTVKQIQENLRKNLDKEEQELLENLLVENGIVQN